jgi:PAS domain S-box-containing protein
MAYTYRLDGTEEIRRLQALLSYNVLDTPQEDEFNNLVNLVSLICNSPIALISMIDDRRQWYKAKTGIDQDEVPRTETLCQYTLQQEELLEIPDTRLDERSKDIPHVTAEGGIRYYAGVNLKASNGSKIGTVCVVDTKPKRLNEEQKQALRLIADQTMILLEARKKNQRLGDQLEEIINDKVKETKRKLLQKETEFNLLLKAIKKSNGVVEFTPNGLIRSVNENFLRIVGYTRQEIIGEYHEILLDGVQKEENEKFWSSLQQGKFHSGRLKRKHKDGSPVWIQATYNPITNEQNKVVKVVKITQDITAEIQAEKSLKRSKELAEMLNIQKDHFIANMSHEIRTPIHAILGFTDLLLELERDTPKKSYLESVRTAGDNLLYIINDILDLSKIEAGIIQLEKEPFDLLQLVKNVFSILHLKAHQKKLSFKYNIDPEVELNLIGDRNRITQILLNLLGNAIKFTSSGSVTLDITPLKYKNKKTTIRFKVTDTGIGIPKDKIEFIFDRFSQAEEDTSRKYGGTGLGLNISRHLIEKQGGEVRVESLVGEGSAFYFFLPFEIGGSAATTVLPEQVAIPEKRKNANILLCEDNELNQRLIRAILTPQGYTIDLAENGEKGVAFLKEKEYDLILMDIQMPIMDGYEATRIIRQEMQSSVPIIALTANFLISEKEKCKKLGMNDYLSKPFTKEDILAKIAGNVETREEGHEKKEEREPEGQHLNMESLNELTGGDTEFRNEMILLFIQQAEKMSKEIEDYAKAGNLTGINATAHALKTSFGVIGADLNHLDKLEKFRGNTPDSMKLPEIINSLKQQLKEIFFILKKFKNAPQNEDPTC